MTPDTGLFKAFRPAKTKARAQGRNRGSPRAFLSQASRSSLGERIMSIFQIKQKTNGAVLWTGSAADAASALDAMAREAGYIDFAALPEIIRAAGPEAAQID